MPPLEFDEGGTFVIGAIDLASSHTDPSILHYLTENSSSSGSVLSFRKHRYSDEASDSSSSEYSSPSYHQSAGEATENPCSTLSIGSEFADINHLKLSDGSHISRQLPKSELSRQPMQFRTSEGEVINEPISTNDLRCDKFGHVEAEEVGDLSVLTSVARNDEEGLRKIAGKKLLNLSEKNSTAGWFVCEGEGILLAHEDSSCSYHDVANMEVLFIADFLFDSKHIILVGT